MRHAPSTGRALPAVLAALLAACVGETGEAPLAPEDATPWVREGLPNRPLLPDAVTCDAPDVQPSRMVRLTRRELDRTIRDLLGVDGVAVDTFPPDDLGAGFEVAATTSPLLAERQLDAAQAVAARATEDLEALVPCDPLADEADCVDAFVDDLARRAYRRPPTEAQRARLRGLYDGARAAGDDVPGAIELVVAAVLLDPAFLFHVERVRGGEAAGLVDGWTMASRLSYLLWGTMPDEALFAAAAGGALDDEAGVAREARRMLEDPRAREGVLAMFRQWLGLDGLDGLRRDPEAYPAAYPGLGADLRRALEAWLAGQTLGGGTVASLHGDAWWFLDGRLAALYGVPGVDGNALVPVSAPDPRAGLVTHPAMLALLARDDQSHPIERGVFVREKLLCQPLPSPPADADLTVPDPSPDATTRERFAAHTENESCAACHSLIDPIGFGLEDYDALGRHRTMEAGRAVDASGEVTGTVDADGPFEGGAALGARLAESGQAAACFAEQWLTYALRRAPAGADACSLRQAGLEALDPTATLADVLVAVATTRAFRSRRAPGEEETR